MTYQKPFEKAEYSDRVAAVKVRMQQAGMCFHFQSGVWLEKFGQIRLFRSTLAWMQRSGVPVVESSPEQRPRPT